MTQQMAILVIPAFAVVIGLLIHSLGFRGKRDTLYFFLFAALFGIARGNIIWWITTVHFEGKFPYIFQRQLLGVYHDSLTADAGWILTLYLGAFLAFRIAHRTPSTQNRVFPLVSLACLFAVCFAYAVESTAITMGWWSWTLSTKSSILREVPMTGIWAWMSVGFDFLVPYVLIRHYRRPGQWWPYLTLLIFPFHMFTHLSNTRVSDFVPITPYGIYHWVMLMAILVLPFVTNLPMRRPWLPDRAQGKTAKGEPIRGLLPALRRNIPFFGLGVVVAVLLACDLGINKEPGILTAKVPLALYTLLAIPLVPVFAVLGTALVLAIFGGIFFIAPIVVPLYYLALKGKDLWPRAPWLRWVYLLIPVALTIWHHSWSQAKNEVDMRYWSFINAGTAMASTDIDEAVGQFQLAANLKPYSLPAYERLIIIHSQKQDYVEAEKVLWRMLELRPISEEVHANFGNIYVMRGDYDEAEMWFRKALELNPDHAYSREMIGNLDRLRLGEIPEGSFELPQ
jgi:Tfp pilus assembly protein PilF